MRFIEPNQPEAEEFARADSREERLLEENAKLRQQLRELSAHPAPARAPRPTGAVVWIVAIGIAVLLAVAFFAGYMPRFKRDSLMRSESQEQSQALPLVNVTKVVRSSANSDLVLSGNIQPVTEAPVLARADGYIGKRMVDIGDRVKAGQPMAQIEAPELDHQVSQARAVVRQAQAALDQAQANYEQGKTNETLAEVTARRWQNLASKGAVSRQENDQYQAQYQAQVSNLESLDKAISSARSNVSSANANLDRLIELQGYQIVKAPFDGVVTLRNIDVGTLINSGNTLLYRVAQTDVLRTYVNVPQTDADAIRVGQPAGLSVSNIPGRMFNGTVTRTSSSLDPVTRTLLVEVQVRNTGDVLLPGMYTLVNLVSSRGNPPLLIPGDTLIVRSDGPQVALVRPDHTVHFQKISIGRDYGDRLEVITGLTDGDMVIVNPSDSVREGVKVEPVSGQEKAAPKNSAQ